MAARIRCLCCSLATWLLLGLLLCYVSSGTAQPPCSQQPVPGTEGSQGQYQSPPQYYYQQPPPHYHQPPQYQRPQHQQHYPYQERQQYYPERQQQHYPPPPHYQQHYQPEKHYHQQPQDHYRHEHQYYQQEPRHQYHSEQQRHQPEPHRYQQKPPSQYQPEYEDEPRQESEIQPEYQPPSPPQPQESHYDERRQPSENENKRDKNKCTEDPNMQKKDEENKLSNDYTERKWSKNAEAIDASGGDQQTKTKSFDDVSKINEKFDNSHYYRNKKLICTKKKYRTSGKVGQKLYQKENFYNIKKKGDDQRVDKESRGKEFYRGPKKPWKIECRSENVYNDPKYEHKIRHQHKKGAFHGMQHESNGTCNEMYKNKENKIEQKHFHSRHEDIYEGKGQKGFKNFHGEKDIPKTHAFNNATRSYYHKNPRHIDKHFEKGKKANTDYIKEREARAYNSKDKKSTELKNIKTKCNECTKGEQNRGGIKYKVNEKYDKYDKKIKKNMKYKDKLENEKNNEKSVAHKKFKDRKKEKERIDLTSEKKKDVSKTEDEKNMNENKIEDKKKSLSRNINKKSKKRDVEKEQQRKEETDNNSHKSPETTNVTKKSYKQSSEDQKKSDNVENVQKKEGKYKKNNRGIKRREKQSNAEKKEFKIEEFLHQKKKKVRRTSQKEDSTLNSRGEKSYTKNVNDDDGAKNKYHDTLNDISKYGRETHFESRRKSRRH